MGNIGNIPIPDPGKSGVFPITSDYGYGYASDPVIFTHQFRSANAKIEQRFLGGSGLTRYTVRREAISNSERDALLAFWDARTGPYQGFDYNPPDGSGAVHCVFENEPLDFEQLVGCMNTLGVSLVEVPETIPAYTVDRDLDRSDMLAPSPDAALSDALLEQVQELIPLVVIEPVDPEKLPYPDILLSDRTCDIGADRYEGRILAVNNIAQHMNGQSDQASFTVGNADRVFTALVDDVNLWRARVTFSLYHVQTQTRLRLWRGEVSQFSGTEGPEFRIDCGDPIYQMQLPYPRRQIVRNCWKVFDDGVNCPYSIVNPGGTETECGKSWRECQTRGMEIYFGGVEILPSRANVKDNSTGTWGLNRRTMTSVSMKSDTIYGMGLQQVYCNRSLMKPQYMIVTAPVAVGRDESDFYVALGIVSEGPIHRFSGLTNKLTLDGQRSHDQQDERKGLRRSVGSDPVKDNDPDAYSQWFGLDRTDLSWIDDATHAAGVAYLMIRRTDDAGRQLSVAQDHVMQAAVEVGMWGYEWSAGGVRSIVPLTNPIWIAANMVLRATGRFGSIDNPPSPSLQEDIIDVDAAAAAAAICDETSFTHIVDPKPPEQFRFEGVIGDRRFLRDWMQDVLANCNGGWVISDGKVKFFIRSNSSTVSAFTEGNIILGSLTGDSIQPRFNKLTANFGDEEFDYAANAVDFEESDHAVYIGAGQPVITPSNINLSGTTTKDQAARIITTLIREELGGITPSEWRKAREWRLRTTVLALEVEPGMVVSVTHPDAPGGGPVEFRVQGWKLMDDFSVEVWGKTTTDSMYDLVTGPKPDDVTALPPPAENVKTQIEAQPWFPYTRQPEATDPLYDSEDYSFKLEQAYEIRQDGGRDAVLVLTGKMPRTVTRDVDPPRIGTVTISDTGGTLRENAQVHWCVTALDANGRESETSEVTTIETAAGVATSSVSFEVTWPANTTHYRLYASYDRHQMSMQVENLVTSPISLTSIPLIRTLGVPRAAGALMHVRAKRSWHSGIQGSNIAAVGSNGDGTGWIEPGGMLPGQDMTGRDYTGRILTVYGRDEATDLGATVEVPLWNMTILSNDATRIQVTPDPLAYAIPVTDRDAMSIRTLATSFSSTFVTDTEWDNPWNNTGGLAPGDEIGRILRLISGTGAGQERRIISNTATQITVDEPFNPAPDGTTVFTVEDSTWEHQSEAFQVPQVAEGDAALFVKVSNLVNFVWRVEVVITNAAGVESAHRVNPSREIYLFGKQGDSGTGSIIIAY